MRDALVGPVAPPEISVLTWNLHRAARGSAAWIRRRDGVRDVLRVERPTILGTQEVLPHQADVVSDALGGSHRMIGHGREPSGEGEGCPLFFDAERLDLLAAEQVTLSRTPHVAGSRSWGTLFPRVVVIGRFRDRATGGTFTAANTHLDVLSPLARTRSAALIADRVGPGPAILTADFNAGPRSRARSVLSGAGLRDTWDDAAEHLTRAWGTFAPGRARTSGARIDAVLARGWRVVRAGIDARTSGAPAASDHLPVLAVLRAREDPA